MDNFHLWASVSQSWLALQLFIYVLTAFTNHKNINYQNVNFVENTNLVIRHKLHIL